MNMLLSSRLMLGVAAATTSLVLLAGCDRRPTDVPPPTSNELERDRTTPSPGMPATPMPQDSSPATPGVPPPASDPAAPAAPVPPAPGGTTQ